MSQKMILCPEVELIAYFMNLTKLISLIHNLIRGYTYPRIIPRKLHNLFPWSLFPRLEKQSWVAFVLRERTMSPLLKSGGREIYDAAHVLHPYPSLHLLLCNLKRKKVKEAILFLNIIIFLHDITDLRGGPCFTRSPDLTLYFLVFPLILPATRNVSLFDQPRQFCFPLLGSYLVSKNTRLLTVELTIK